MQYSSKIFEKFCITCTESTVQYEYIFMYIYSVLLEYYRDKLLLCLIRYNEPSPRYELLHNINPESQPVGDNLYPDIFDVRVRSAIRVGDYKLLTGDPEYFPGGIIIVLYI